MTWTKVSYSEDNARMEIIVLLVVTLVIRKPRSTMNLTTAKTGMGLQMNWFPIKIPCTIICSQHWELNFRILTKSRLSLLCTNCNTIPLMTQTMLFVILRYWIVFMKFLETPINSWTCSNKLLLFLLLIKILKLSDSKMLKTILFLQTTILQTITMVMVLQTITMVLQTTILHLQITMTMLL